MPNPLLASNPGYWQRLQVDQEYLQSRDYEFDYTLMRNYIQESSLFSKSSITSSGNSLFNNSKIVVVNNSLNLSKEINVKLFSDIYTDKINQFQSASTYNNLLPQFSYNSYYNKRFAPFINNYYFQFKRLTAKSQLLITSTYNTNKYSEADSISENKSYELNLQSTFGRRCVAAFYTYQVDSSRVLEFSFQNIWDTKNQELNILSEAPRTIDTFSSVLQEYQFTNNRIVYSKAELRYIFKNKKGFTNRLSLTNIHLNTSFNANLNIRNAGQLIAPPGFVNEFTLNHNNILLKYSLGFNFQKFSFSADLGPSFYIDRLTGINYNGPPVIHTINPNSRLALRFRQNSSSDFSLTTELTNNIPTLDITALNPLLSSYRSIISNENYITNVPRLNITLAYSYRNITNGVSVITAWYHSTQFKSEISSITFARDFDYYRNRYEAVFQNIDNIFFKFDKYYQDYKTAISFKGSVSKFDIPIESQNQIVSNVNLNYNIYAAVRPSITDNITMNWGINYNLTTDQSSLRNTYQLNPFTELSASLKQRISLTYKINYFTSNYSDIKSDYWFANITGWYTIKQSKIDLKLTVNNIFNTHNIYAGVNNAVLSRTTVSNILPRYALVEFIYKF